MPQYIWNPAAFLNDTGLLFEINRRILHPFGLSLIVSLPTSPEEEALLVPCISEASLYDAREEPDGLTFDSVTFHHGMQAIERFERQHSVALEARLQALGFLVQGRIPSEARIQMAYAKYREILGDRPHKWSELSANIRHAWHVAASILASE